MRVPAKRTQFYLYSNLEVFFSLKNHLFSLVYVTMPNKIDNDS